VTTENDGSARQAQRGPAASFVERMTGRSLAGRELRTGVGTMALSAALIVLNTVTTLLLTRLAGASGYGEFAIAIAAATILSILGGLGLGPLIVRSITTYRVRGHWSYVRGAMRRAHLVLVSWSTVLVLLAAAVGPLLWSDESTLRAYWLGLLLVPLATAATVRQSIMQAFGRVLLARIPETLLQPLLFLVAILAIDAAGTLTGDRAVTSYVVTMAIAFAVGTIVLFRILPHEARRDVPTYEMRSWARSATPLFALTLVNAFSDQVDTLLLGIFHDSTSAGIFSAADRAALLVSFLLVSSTYALGPRLARLWTEGHRAEFQRLLTQVSRLAFGAAVCIAAVLIAFGTQIMELFGSGFASGRGPLTVLCIGQLANAASGAVGLALLMTANERIMTRSIAIASVISVGLNVALIPAFGTMGAAVGTALGVIVANTLLLLALWQTTGVWAAGFGPPRRPAGRRTAQ
jgi:O-antigen/teichoic acid export membrane protein